VSDAALRAELRRRAAERVRLFSPEVTATRLREALEALG
jgi:hypothetical protein